MDKPLPCNQKWDDMLPSDGGRICVGCGKLVVDFRKSSWANIKQVHQANPTPTCGIYDEKQIANWGQQIPNEKLGCSKLVHLSAALLALSQFLPTDIQGQTKSVKATITTKQTTLPKAAKPTPKNRVVNGTVVKQLADSTKRPLAGVTIFIYTKGLKFETKTDSVGRYSINITSEFLALPDKFELTASHPDFMAHSILLDKNNLRPIEIIFQEVVISTPRPTITTKESTISYYVAYSIEKKKIRPIKTLTNKLKKWWQRKPKE